MEVTVREAKTHLSRLVKLAEDGETITIIRRGVPVARLIPVPSTMPRRLGWDHGHVPDTEFRPMTNEEAEGFLSGR